MSQSPANSETILYTPQVPDADAVTMGWMYPYTYGVSMSSLGYLTLFSQLDQRRDVAARRINTDTMAQESIEDLDMLGFSFSFELDILEIVRMLTHYELPLFAHDRSDEVPLIFAGGPVVMTNPEPYADFFDFYLIGEGETMMADFVTAYKRLRHITSRKELLTALALAVPGLYVPSLYHVEYGQNDAIESITPLVAGLPFPVEKQIETDMNATLAATPILSKEAVFSNTFLVEVMRGCAHRCRFCLASYSMLPARGASIESLIERIDFGLHYTPKVGLLGALIADHPEFETLCDHLNQKEGIQITAASLRADTLTPKIAQTFAKGGQKTLTIAIESGSESLRKRINKHLKSEDIHQAAAITAEAGISTLKLYMMAGLPGETWADLDETVALVKSLKKENPRLKLVFGCSTFVPKAATPFQWTMREDTKLLQEKHDFYRKSLYKYCDYRPSSAKWDTVQALLSRGDRRLSHWILEFIKQGANLGALNRTYKTMSHTAIPVLEWYATRERPEHEVLPWDALFLGVNKATLYRESGLSTSANTISLMTV